MAQVILQVAVQTAVRAVTRTAVNALLPARQVGARLGGVQLSGGAQGEPVRQVFGRMRVAGTVIWAARFRENRSTTHASKTAPRTERFSYSLSFAVALCEGPIDGVGRIWADGQLLDQSNVSYRLYRGDEDQTPDALIEAVEGTAPAYRGLAYLVFEDLDISQFGNRPPSLSVEVFRRPRGDFGDLESAIEGVCLIPGAGEFVYATAPNAVLSGMTRARFETQHTGDGRPDFVVALDQLAAALPNLRRVNLVVSWFGTSLDAGACQVVPGVESADKRTVPLTWSVAGVARADAHVVSQIDGRPAYGGTPSDEVVVAAVRALKARGYEVTLVPFILMDCAGFPWRGRIEAAAAADVAAFAGRLSAFVCHVARLGVAAGGVDGVLLGSELRGLTKFHDGGYPMVEALRAMGAAVRAIVGSGPQISYGADWSEYFGHHDGGDVRFHLDALWADANIDYVGIDWYAPLTDWREGEGHLDWQGGVRSIYDSGYLEGRIRGGEGFEWYYASDADRDAQVRTPIADGAHGEDWVFRPKDVVAWWSNAHHDRVGGVRSGTATVWVPQSKPVRFLEIGCGAVDKGPNAPNLFLDPKSSESALPPFSTGARDDRAQRAYLKAYYDWYAAHNPVSAVYGGPMLDGMAVWCWDARPYPYFPQAKDVWGDADNWRTGHWLNGRMGAGDARNVIAAIAAQAGAEIACGEVSGTIDGYVIEQPMRAADALSPVLEVLGLEVAERGGGLSVVAAGAGADCAIGRDDLAWSDQAPVMVKRDLGQVPASLTLRCYDPDRDYQIQAVTVRADDVAGAGQVSADLPLCLTAGQAAAFARYALRQAQRVRESVVLDADPLMLLRLEPGDGVTVEGEAGLWRVVSVTVDETPSVTLSPMPEGQEHVAADPSLGGGVPGVVAGTVVTGFRLLELPCFGVDTSDVRPVLVPSADPWRGADVYAGAGADSLRLRGRVEQAGSVGVTLTALPAQRGDVLLRSAFVDIYVEGEAPVSRSEAALLSGENVICLNAANGEWEMVQFLTVTALGVDRYRLTGLVRGQWGSEQARMAGVREGAEVVMLPAVATRAEVALDEIGIERLWRVGRPGFGGAAAGALDVRAAWTGLGLRPRAPVHGRVSGVGDLTVTWLRAPRYGGDSWDAEPPLCEDVELYRVQVWDGAVLKRSVEVGTAAWVYGAADQAADFPGGFGTAARVEVAQKSVTVGYGPVLRVGLG